MKKIARWAAMVMAVVAASAALPAFADGDEPEATGTATLADNILTLSGLVTNITAEADLGADVTNVVMTQEGGVSFGNTLTLAKTYTIDGTGVVGVAEGKIVSTPMARLSTKGHTFVKDGPGTLYISSGAPGAVAETTRWIVKGGELRIRHTGSFYGNHSGTTTNLTLDLREGATYYQEQVLNATDSPSLVAMLSHVLLNLKEALKSSAKNLVVANALSISIIYQIANTCIILPIYI